jgi:hypothetical protein
MGKKKDKKKDKSQRRRQEPAEVLAGMNWTSQHAASELENIRTCLQRLSEEIQCVRRDICALVDAESPDGERVSV